jgi:hypothetical protein
LVNYGWLVVEPYPSEKYEFVSWDDDIPNSWGKSFKIPFQTTNQQPIGLFSMVGTTPFQLPDMAIDHRNIPGFDGGLMVIK